MKDFISRIAANFNSRLLNIKLPFALTCAVLISIVMTAVSVAVYQQSGVSQLDLSRPGFENARKQVETKKAPKTFSSSGPINTESIDEFLTLLRTQNKELKNTSDFGDQNLDDVTLDLHP